MLSCCLTLNLKMNKIELKLVVRRSEVLLFEVPTACSPVACSEYYFGRMSFLPVFGPSFVVARRCKSRFRY